MAAGMPGAFVSTLTGQKSLASKLSYMSANDPTQRATSRTLQNVMCGEQSTAKNFDEILKKERRKEAQEIKKINQQDINLNKSSAIVNNRSDGVGNSSADVGSMRYDVSNQSSSLGNREAGVGNRSADEDNRSSQGNWKDAVATRSADMGNRRGEEKTESRRKKNTLIHQKIHPQRRKEGRGRRKCLQRSLKGGRRDPAPLQGVPVTEVAVHHLLASRGEKERTRRRLRKS